MASLGSAYMNIAIDDLPSRRLFGGDGRAGVVSWDRPAAAPAPDPPPDPVETQIVYAQRFFRSAPREHAGDTSVAEIRRVTAGMAALGETTFGGYIRALRDALFVMQAQLDAFRIEEAWSRQRAAEPPKPAPPAARPTPAPLPAHVIQRAIERDGPYGDPLFLDARQRAGVPLAHERPGAMEREYRFLLADEARRFDLADVLRRYDRFIVDQLKG